MGMGGLLWVLVGNWYVYMGIGYRWESMGICGYWWVTMGMGGYLWVLVGNYGYGWVSMGIGENCGY